MGSTRYLYSILDRRIPDKTGNKAENILWLQRHGFHVPQALFCIWDAYEGYIQNNLEMINSLRKEIDQNICQDKKYAIRSSANLEDSTRYSFAGQFKTALFVQGTDQILQSMWSIWAMVRAKGVDSYLGKISENESIRMGIIIQEMVHPVVSGVAFSKNPMTGADEVVIEAVEGLGTKLVQEGLVPYRWVIKGKEWSVSPTKSVVPDSIIHTINEGTRKIASLIKKPVDVEWVFDGKDIFWLQMRPITTLNQVNIYSNNISREQLPGQIPPLVWSVNVPLVTGAWIKLLSEFIGRNDLTPNHLVKQFYYQAYYNMGALGQIFERMGLPSQSLEMMMGIGRSHSNKPKMVLTWKTLPMIPRIIRFLVNKFFLDSTLQSVFPKFEAEIKQLSGCFPNEVSSIEARERYCQIYELVKQLAYYNIIVPLTASILTRVMEYQLKKIGKDPSLLRIEQVYSSPYANVIGKAIRDLHFKWMELPPDYKKAISNATYPQFCAMEGIEPFKTHFHLFIDQFGYLTESTTNFATPAWRDNPARVLQMVANYQPMDRTYSTGYTFQQVKFRPQYQWMMNKLFNEVIRYKIYHERIGYLFTRGYALFGDLFRQIGEGLVNKGLLDVPEDIHYLQEDEIWGLLGTSSFTGYSPREKIQQCKIEMESCADVSLPEVIYGENPPPVIYEIKDRLVGVPTSSGYYTGRIKIIRSLQEFGKLEKGEILVVPFTDISWTPLFSKAGGIISESGGLLSHTSIIAREYQIPAIVSVDGATQLKDSTLVTMDGFRGEICVHST